MKHKKVIYKSLTDVMGLGLVGAVATLVGDAIWLYHDVSTNGFFPVYFAIGGLIFSGLVLSVIATVKHIKLQIKRSTKKKIVL